MGGGEPTVLPTRSDQWPGWSAAKAAAVAALCMRYVWWKSSAEAMRQPERVIAQAMNMGDHRDVEDLARLVGDAVLRDVLTHAEPGQFGDRAWAYWHYRLGLAEVGGVPRPPRRSFGR